MLSVVISSSIGDSFSRWMPSGGDRAVAHRRADRLGAVRLRQLGGRAQRARRRGHVVDQDAILALHVAHQFERLHLRGRRPVLAGQRQAGIQQLRIRIGHLQAARIRRHHHAVLRRQLLAQIAHHHRRRIQ